MLESPDDSVSTVCTSRFLLLNVSPPSPQRVDIWDHIISYHIICQLSRYLLESRCSSVGTGTYLMLRTDWMGWKQGVGWLCWVFPHCSLTLDINKDLQDLQKLRLHLSIRCMSRLLDIYQIALSIAIVYKSRIYIESFLDDFFFLCRVYSGAWSSSCEICMDTSIPRSEIDD